MIKVCIIMESKLIRYYLIINIRFILSHMDKKPSLIFARSKTNKNAQYSAIEQQTGTALQ